MRDLFWAVSRAYTQFDCEAAMEKVIRIDPQAREYIDEKIVIIGPMLFFFPD